MIVSSQAQEHAQLYAAPAPPSSPAGEPRRVRHQVRTDTGTGRSGWRSDPRGWLRSRPRAVMVTAQVGALALAVWLLIVPRVRQASAPLRVLLDVDSSWIVLAVLAELASLTAYALTTRAILPSTTRPGLGRVLRIDLSSIALTHCVPSGGAAGTVLSWRLLAAAGVPSGQAAAAKLAQGLFATIVLQVLLLGAFCSGLPTTGLGRWNTGPAALCVVMLLVVLVAVIALRRPKVRAACGRAVRWLPRFGQRLADSAERVYRHQRIDQLAETFLSRPVLLRAAGFAAANWALDAVALWAAVAAYGPPVAVEGLATAIAIQTFAAWLPITPGGLGLADGMMIPALIAFGASSSSAVLGVLTWRLIAYWLPMPLGALAYGSLRLGRGRGVRRRRARPPEPSQQQR